MIAKGSKTRRFWNTSMTLILDPESLGGWPRKYSYDDGWKEISGDGLPGKYIFCSDELPDFCRLLLETCRYDDSILRNIAFYIDINPTIGNGEANNIDGYPAGLARLKKLFGPLYRLHSFGAAQVDGPLSGSYKGDIVSSLCKQPPTAVDIMNKTIVFLEQAGEENRRGQLLRAKLMYKAALSFVCFRTRPSHEQNVVMSSGPFPELTAGQTIGNIAVRLQARIAAVYFESGQLRMARIYTERALDPRRAYDHRHNKMYTLDIEHWERIVYAEVRHVAAKISYIHGHVWAAVGDLQDANEFVPLNEEQKDRYEAWQRHADRLSSRRAEKRKARELNLQKREESLQGINTPEKLYPVPEKKRLTVLLTEKFMVACNWKKKGDRLLRSDRSELATTKYKSALSKVEWIAQNQGLHFTITSGMFESYLARDGLNALRFKLQASVAASYLMSRKHKEVIQAISAALDCNPGERDCSHRWYDNCRHAYSVGNRDWAEDQRYDFAKVYYCRALGLAHMGDTELAVKNMEKALDLDPGDGTTYAQLVLLKRKLEEKNTRLRDKIRRKRANKLNVEQDKVRKKQERRRAKVRGSI